MKDIGSVKRKQSLSRVQGHWFFQAYSHLDLVGGLKLSICYNDSASDAFSTWHEEQINSVKLPDAFL